MRASTRRRPTGRRWRCRRTNSSGRRGRSSFEVRSLSLSLNSCPIAKDAADAILACSAAGLFENAYASFLRTPEKARTPRQEQRLLRRLESTYIELEQLDNPTPDVVELRAQRVERALWINARLVEIDGMGIDEETDSEDDGEESDEEELSGRMARQARMD